MSSFHLAGIVPVAAPSLDFGMDWDDCMMPLAPNYTAIEHAVLECATAGCDTIWIVCNDDTKPLVRHRVGEYIQDPVWLGRTFDKHPSESRKPIPIFYVPIHPNDRDKRDCLSWSVVYGVASVYHISKGLSKWVTPRKYYISFPYGIYDTNLLREHRKKISSEKSFCLVYDDKSVCEGEYLSFTMGEKEFFMIRDEIRKKGTGLYKGYHDEKLPIEERYSARYFSLKDVFSVLSFDEASKIIPEWYYPIDSWNRYCEYLSSSESKGIQRPSKVLMSYHEWNKIGEDNYEP